MMREHQLRASHRYRMRRWSVGKPSVLIANLLKRQFTVTRRNKARVTDITYIRTWRGWLYLAVVLMAVRRRRPRRTVIHSDHRHAVRQRDLRTLTSIPVGAV